MNGRIIILNGTSSAGKSTLARALRAKLEPQFNFYSSDQLADAHFRPLDPVARANGRDRFYDGFHRSIAAFAAAGLDLLVEHIVEEQSWVDNLKLLLAPYDVFWVAVHAPIFEIERRERARGNRTIGEGRYHLKTHMYCRYSVEVDTAQSIALNVNVIVAAWQNRSRHAAAP